MSAGDEKSAATMTPLLLEEALSSAAVPSRRNRFVTDNFDTELLRRHSTFDDDAGRARLVDGARDDHMIFGSQPNLEGRGSHHATMTILAEDSKEGDDGFQHDAASHSKALKFLSNKGPNFMMKNLDDKETICGELLDMADNVKALPPADEPSAPWDILNMCRWKDSLCELIKEMKTVEEMCPSLLCNSGVYVVTTSPYAAFLRALAAEILDR